MKKEELNNNLRDKLEGFTPEVPSHVWNNIQQSLKANNRKRKMAYYSWIAAAALVVLAFIAGWYYNENTKQKTPQVAKQNINPAEQQKNKSHALTKKDSVNIHSEENDSIVDAAMQSNNFQANGNVKTEILQEPAVIDFPRNNISSIKNNSIEEEFNMERLNPRDHRLLEKKERIYNLKSSKNGNLNISDYERKLVAQNAALAAEQKSNEKGWKLGMEIAPGYSSQAAKHSESYTQSMTYRGSSGNETIGGGISIQYKMGGKWSVESGVYYAQNGQRSSNSLKSLSYQPNADSYFNTEVSSNRGNLSMNSTAGVIEFSGTPEGTEFAATIENGEALVAAPGSNVLITNSEFSQIFDFIEIPLYIRYNLITSRIGVQVMGGLNTGIVAGNNVYMENSNGVQKIGKTRNISSINFSGTIGLGLSYDLGRRISLAIEPRINYYLNSINQNPDVDYRPYRIGMYTGVYYEF